MPINTNTTVTEETKKLTDIEKRDLIENIILPLIPQYGPYTAAACVKDIFNGKKVEYIQPDTLAYLKPIILELKTTKGIYTIDVQNVMDSHGETRKQLQQIMASMMQEETLSANDAALKLRGILDDKSQFPTNLNGTLLDRVYHGHLNALDTDYVFTPNRLKAVDDLMTKANVSPVNAFRILDHSSGDAINVMSESIMEIKSRLSNYMLTIVMEQHTTIDDVHADLKDFFANMGSKYSIRGYDHIRTDIVNAVTQKIKGIEVSEFVLKLIDERLIQKLNEDGISLMINSIDSDIYQMVSDQLVLPLGYRPETLAGMDPIRILQIKMHYINSNICDAWKRNNTGYTLPTANCPVPTPCEYIASPPALPYDDMCPSVTPTTNYGGLTDFNYGLVVGAVACAVAKPVLKAAYNTLKFLFFSNSEESSAVREKREEKTLLPTHHTKRNH